MSYVLSVPEPLRWFSQLDEELFFHGLKQLRGVKSISVLPGKPLQGVPNQVELQLEENTLDDDSLRNLIGLMFRYSTEMQSLSGLCTDENKSWFRDENKFWYEAIFGGH